MLAGLEDITITRPLMDTASDMSWVTNIAVMPSFLIIEPISSDTNSLV